MRNRMLFVAVVLLLATLSPVFGAGLMTPEDGSIPPLQIKQHDVRVVINNGFAITEVDQVFHNPHDQDLDALYTFPLPRDASLSELSLWIDGEEVIGEVVEKERARKIASKEKAAGNDTALAEQREYYAFDVFVSPVRAGQDTRVRLVYLQPLEIDMGVGRYVYPLEEGEIDQEAGEFWDLLPRVEDRFTFDCDIKSSYPLEDVRTTAGEDVTTVSTYTPGFWNIRIDAIEGAGSLDRDVVVYYRLDQSLPARVDLLAYRAGEDPGTFLVVVTPGTDLRETVGGVDWTIVVDVSSSMENKIRTASRAIADAIGQMDSQDRFRLIDFSNDARFVIAKPTLVTPAAIDRASKKLSGLRTRGGTNVYAGLELAVQDLDADRPNAVILVSDGGANIGPTGHRAFLELLEDTDIRVFTLVMGQGANRPLLERLASESGGFAMSVSNRDDLYGRLIQAKAKLGREAMHGVKLTLEGVGVEQTSPARLPSAYYGQQIVLFGRYTRPGMARLRLDGRISGRDLSWETSIDLPAYEDTYPELERIWALSRVQDFQRLIEDEGEKSRWREAVVEVGTTYSIVTEYTSMIVVRPDRFEENGIDRKNERRVGRERAAREGRQTAQPRDTRADTHQPMYPGRSSHGLGGGAAGPAALVSLLAFVGVRFLLRRRSR